MKKTLTLLLVALSFGLAAQKNYTFTDAVFKGVVEETKPDGTITNIEVSDTLVSQFLGINEWHLSIDTARGIVHVAGFRPDDDTPSWTDVVLAVQKTRNASSDLKYLAMCDGEGKACVMMWEKYWTRNKDKKRCQRWRLKWIAIHDADVTTRTIWGHMISSTP